MKLHIYPRLIFRTPRFSMDSHLSQCWEELKEAIAESSDDFYQLIKDLKAAEVPSQPVAVRHTIWKYFNRARHRSTPFGRFAAVGTCPAAYDPRGDTITVSSTPEYHRFVDWTLKNENEYTFEELVQAGGSLFANSTYYPFGENLRYITFQDGRFEIAEMEPDAFVHGILELCRQPLPVQQVLSRLRELHPEMGEVQEHITSLISLQLLFTSLDANITGEDYFRRIGLDIGQAKRQYVISERKCTHGAFDLRLLRRLDGLIGLLRQLLPANENTQLQEFVRRFQSRFDRREVPLMEALDPETGVGYGQMEEMAATDDLILQLAGNKSGPRERDVTLKTILEKELSHHSATRRKTIQLDTLKPGAAPPAPPLPNTFNCLFSVADGLACIAHIGGVSATALAGRFTLAVDDIHQFAKEMAAVEQQANPDVVFFDLAYMAETNVDNVNRRRHIYDYQLAMLNYDTSPSPLTADDILISIRGNEPILRSKRLNKRLVPRLSSAYNHVRSDLPLFRLLCDMQQHGLQANLTVQPEQLFPHLAHYPSLRYHNIVLSPEKWRTSSEEARPWLEGKAAATGFRAYLSHLGVCRHLCCGVGDQTLYFDLEDDGDVEALRHYLRRRGELLLEEAIRPRQAIVADEQGRPYAAQFMATIMHRERIYTGLEGSAGKATGGAAQRAYLPGSEWLYFEIHCHPHRMDSLLCGAIHAFLERHVEAVAQWFFIRYDEQGPHLRLRLRLGTPGDGQMLTSSLSSHLDKEYHQGTVTDIRLRVYQRELERYGHDMIDLVEQHFCRDSRYVLSILRAGCTDYQLYALCMALAEKVRAANLPGLRHFGALVGTVLQSLQEEHRTHAADFAQLNKRYRDYRDAGRHFILPHGAETLAVSFLQVLEQCPPERRGTLFVDLFHMHVNRLFAQHQRTHELVIYYFMDKAMKQGAHSARANAR